MKKFALKLLDRLGYTVTGSWKLEKVVLAKRLKSIFDKYTIDVVIDVGANKGQYRDFLRDEVGFVGRIESFEPIPELFQTLQRRALSDAKWTIHDCALGAASGSLQLNIMAGSDFSSFLQPKNAITNFFNDENKIEQKISVAISTLDEKFGDSFNKNNVYLKIDTQGFDLEVLRGAKQFIKYVKALQTEISFIPFYENMPNYHDSIREFGENGFEVADIFLVAGDRIGRAMEFDCIMVKSQ